MKAQDACDSCNAGRVSGHVHRRPCLVGALQSAGLGCQIAWRRGVPIAIVGILAILMLLVLSLGNTQWHRYIYIFQCYYLPGHDGMKISWPEGFSGTWRTWYKNGRKEFVDAVRNGKQHGTSTRWCPSGKKKEWAADFRMGQKHGREMEWNPCGKLQTVLFWEHGTLKRIQSYNSAGSLSRIVIFLSDRLCRKELLTDGKPTYVEWIDLSKRKGSYPLNRRGGYSPGIVKIEEYNLDGSLKKGEWCVKDEEVMRLIEKYQQDIRELPNPPDEPKQP